MLVVRDKKLLLKIVIVSLIVGVFALADQAAHAVTDVDTPPVVKSSSGYPSIKF